MGRGDGWTDHTGPVRLPGTLTSFAAADAAIALAIFCAGSWLGVAAVRGFQAAGGTPYFYQSEFGPAVMMACGRGFQGPDTRTEPALAAFLLQQSDAFDCTQLTPAVATVALTPFQRASEYLEFAVAMTWKVTGVSWSRLVILPGAFFGAVAALTYGVLRLGLSRLFALLALVPSVISTPNFMIVPQLRDYAKGPFLLATILLMGALVTGSGDRRRIVGLSVIAGAVIGIGLGFRFDLVIAVLPFVLTAAFLVPADVAPSTRILAIAAFLAALAAATVPLLRGPSGNGSNAGHVALLGLSADFDRPLRVEPSIYEFAGQYNDSLAFSIINSYAIRVEDQRQGVNLSTSAYDRAALGYLTQLARVFPADLVTRIVSASRTIPKYFLDSSLFAPIQVQSPFVRGLYSLRGTILVAPRPTRVHCGRARHADGRCGQRARGMSRRAGDRWFCRSVGRPVRRAALLLPAVHPVVRVRAAGASRIGRQVALRKTDHATRRPGTHGRFRTLSGIRGARLCCHARTSSGPPRGCSNVTRQRRVRLCPSSNDRRPMAERSSAPHSG